MRRWSEFGSPVRALAIAGVIGAALAGCSSSPGQSADPGDTLGNLFAFNSTKAPPVADAPQATGNVICPVVDVRSGGAAHRVYGGGSQTNADVRYQFSIGETARECTVEGNQIVIRVGVEGKVLLGPAGSAGSFTVPVFIGVQRDEGLQMLTSKVYSVSASIAPGATQTTFSVVSEPLTVPYTRENAAGDYTIYVGFEGQRETRPREARRRAR